MSTYSVLITDYAWPDVEIERQILAAVGAQLMVAETGSAEDIIRLAPQAHAILTCWAQIPPAALEAATHCQLVSRYGIGLDNIPIQRATELGILVTNVPDFCAEEVSDHAMALLLATARQIVPQAAASRAGRWQRDTGQIIPRLRGQTLGLVGYGNSARALVPKAQGFGLDIIAYTPRLTPGRLANGVEAVDRLDDLLARADYVSLHAPLTDETSGLIDRAALRRMKPNAVLINTSRGGLIDETALVHALREGWIAGAGLDVLAQEPPPPDHPLLALPNVIVTPHAAFYSEASIAELQQKAAQNVADVLQGKRPAHIVNPEVLGQANCRV
ncbi:MAG: C-terminal binding protein [Caldilineaceae bacterium]